MTKLAPTAPIPEAEQQEALVALCQGHAQHRNGAQQQQAGIGLARAEAVAQRADQQAHDDGDGDGGDVDVGDLRIDRPNSPLMTGISGAQANQAKKQTKNAIQVRWNARICGVEIEKSLMLVALLAMFYPVQKTKRRPRNHGHLRPGWADAVVLPTRLWASVCIRVLRGDRR
jgi:hypothetical protein